MYPVGSYFIHIINPFLYVQDSITGSFIPGRIYAFLILSFILCLDCVAFFRFFSGRTLYMGYGSLTGTTNVCLKSRDYLRQCFSTAGPRPGSGPWHQLYRAARDSPGIDN